MHGWGCPFVRRAIRSSQRREVIYTQKDPVERFRLNRYSTEGASKDDKPHRKEAEPPTIQVGFHVSARPCRKVLARADETYGQSRLE